MSDVMMPGGLSGLQLARGIRRRHPVLTIVLTTGYVESVADMKDGEFGVLIKPYTVESLASALRIELQAEESTPEKLASRPAAPAAPSIVELASVGYTVCASLHRRHSCL